MTNRNLEAALRYAGRGWHVFPLVGKIPATKNGYEDATTDPETIKAWWGAHPLWNVGCAMGKSGLLGLDFDPAKMIEKSHEFLAECRAASDTWESRTGGGGTHLIYELPEGYDLGNKTGSLQPGIDVRVTGYLVLPPSIHPDTKRPYELVRDVKPQPLPDFVEETTRSKPNPGTKPAGAPVTATKLTDVLWSAYRAANGDRVKELVENVPPRGQRSEAFASLVNHLAFWCADRDHLAETLAGTGWAEYWDEKGHRDPIVDKAFSERVAAYGSTVNGGIAAMVLTGDVDEALVHTGGDDEGNARAVLLLHGDRVLHTGSHGWMAWTGTHWVTRAEAKVHGLVVETLIRKRVAAVKRAASDKNMETVVAASKTSNYNVKGCLDMLKPKIHVGIDEFDREPHLLNVANGVVNLQTGELTPHDPSQRFTYCVNVPYVPGAENPEWVRFLKESVLTDEMVDYLRIAMGYSLTGDTREECLFYPHGPTRSGKGTFSEIMLELLGIPLAKQADFKTFTAVRTGDTQNFDLAGLKPTRFVVAGESGHYESLNEAKVKQATGGDWIRCAHKYGDAFEYRPQFKIWLVSNHPPKGDVDDDAFWYRIKVIPFPVSKAGHEDKTLKFRLKSPDGLVGILAWAVSGAIDWYKNGLPEPTAVKEATNEARDKLDFVQAWINDETTPDPEARIPIATLRKSYEAWCHNNGVPAKNSARLGDSLRHKGFEVVKSGGWQVKGLSLFEIPV